ncbi:ATP-binding cassette domain-containing protein [Novosphingobium sp. ZN18A2]|uniref:ATP-binding cassette domain-containing protein n=1 Tax=Novosphingobium sp. ZN18A2 TaxID=3079861 RepID=UPI0030CF8B09
MAEGPGNDLHTGDALIDCIGQVAERFGVTFAPGMFASLARHPDGRLPLHQAEPALELLGLNCDVSRRARLPSRPENYPAIVSLGEAGAVVVHEVKDGEALVWRPGPATAQWEKLSDIADEYAGWMATVFGDPSTMRDAGAPWQQRAQSHWFWSELYKLRREFWPVLLASVIINFLALAYPLFSMNVYDRVIPNRAQATLWVLAVGVLIAFALDFSLRRARTRVLDQIGRDLDLKLSEKIYSKVLSAPLAGRKGHTGNLVARVSEFSIVRDFYASTTIVLIVDMAFLVLFIAVISYIAGWLALVPLVAAACMGIFGLRLQRKVSRVALEAQADYGLQQTLLVESISGMETLKSLAGEGVMLGRWRRISEVGSHSQRRLRDISSAAIGLASTFQQVCSIGLVVGGYYLFAAGQITMGSIIAIVMLATRSLSPAAQFAFLLTRSQQARKVLDTLQELWAEQDERKMGSASLTPSVHSANVVTEGLAFTYPESSTPSLSNINITINPGDRIAIVGRVASGKSTLGRVLCGLYQPTDGAMRIDGIDSRQYRPQDLREAFRFVGQDAALFSGSVKDNLAIGAGIVSDDQLLEALKKVGADEFLSRDESGFDRGVGESGIRLSGGQRSFLSLARAMVRPAKLLFLDEPTGAMDSQSEQLFVERLSRSMTPGQTLLIATHRPALFTVCNRLIVLDKGQVVADGPRDEIISSAGGGLKS